jgi:GNAT superfamily N-acetyltransferase
MPSPAVFPLTPDRWPDFERLFGPRGACGGCWCVWWKLRGREFDRLKGNGARAMQADVVASGEVPGLLAYVDGAPVGWIAVEPRSRYPRLAGSRILAPLDGLPVWSVTCFFVDRRFRSRGITVDLLRAAVDWVAARGGEVLEGYPVEPDPGVKEPPLFVYTGLASAFRSAGFVEVARRSPRRPVMRFYIKDYPADAG